MLRRLGVLALATVVSLGGAVWGLDLTNHVGVTNVSGNNTKVIVGVPNGTIEGTAGAAASFQVENGSGLYVGPSQTVTVSGDTTTANRNGDLILTGLGFNNLDGAGTAGTLFNEGEMVFDAAGRMRITGATNGAVVNATGGRIVFNDKSLLIAGNKASANLSNSGELVFEAGSTVHLGTDASIAITNKAGGSISVDLSTTTKNMGTGNGALDLLQNTVMQGGNFYITDTADVGGLMNLAVNTDSTGGTVHTGSLDNFGFLDMRGAGTDRLDLNFGEAGPGNLEVNVGGAVYAGNITYGTSVKSVTYNSILAANVTVGAGQEHNLASGAQSEGDITNNSGGTVNFANSSKYVSGAITNNNAGSVLNLTTGVDNHQNLLKNTTNNGGTINIRGAGDEAGNKTVTGLELAGSTGGTVNTGDAAKYDGAINVGSSGLVIGGVSTGEIAGLGDTTDQDAGEVVITGDVRAGEFSAHGANVKKVTFAPDSGSVVSVYTDDGMGITALGDIKVANGQEYTFGNGVALNNGNVVNDDGGTVTFAEGSRFRTNAVNVSGGKNTIANGGTAASTLNLDTAMANDSFANAFNATTNGKFGTLNITGAGATVDVNLTLVSGVAGGIVNTGNVESFQGVDVGSNTLIAGGGKTNAFDTVTFNGNVVAGAIERANGVTTLAYGGAVTGDLTVGNGQSEEFNSGSSYLGGTITNNGGTVKFAENSAFNGAGPAEILNNAGNLYLDSNMRKGMETISSNSYTFNGIADAFNSTSNDGAIHITGDTDVTDNLVLVAGGDTGVVNTGRVHNFKAVDVKDNALVIGGGYTGALGDVTFAGDVNAGKITIAGTAGKTDVRFSEADGGVAATVSSDVLVADGNSATFDNNVGHTSGQIQIGREGETAAGQKGTVTFEAGSSLAYNAADFDADTGDRVTGATGSAIDLYNGALNLDTGMTTSLGNAFAATRSNGEKAVINITGSATTVADDLVLRKGSGDGTVNTGKVQNFQTVNVRKNDLAVAQGASANVGTVTFNGDAVAENIVMSDMVDNIVYKRVVIGNTAVGAGQSQTFETGSTYVHGNIVNGNSGVPSSGGTVEFKKDSAFNPTGGATITNHDGTVKLAYDMFAGAKNNVIGYDDTIIPSIDFTGIADAFNNTVNNGADAVITITGYNPLGSTSITKDLILKAGSNAGTVNTGDVNNFRAVDVKGNDLVLGGEYDRGGVGTVKFEGSVNAKTISVAAGSGINSIRFEDYVNGDKAAVSADMLVADGLSAYFGAGTAYGEGKLRIGRDGQTAPAQKGTVTFAQGSGVKNTNTTIDLYNGTLNLHSAMDADYNGIGAAFAATLSNGVGAVINIDGNADIAQNLALREGSNAGTVNTGAVKNFWGVDVKGNDLVVGGNSADTGLGVVTFQGSVNAKSINAAAGKGITEISFRKTASGGAATVQGDTLVVDGLTERFGDLVTYNQGQMEIGRAGETAAMNKGTAHFESGSNVNYVASDFDANGNRRSTATGAAIDLHNGTLNLASDMATGGLANAFAATRSNGANADAAVINITGSADVNQDLALRVGSDKGTVNTGAVANFRGVNVRGNNLIIGGNAGQGITGQTVGFHGDVTAGHVAMDAGTDHGIRNVNRAVFNGQLNADTVAIAGGETYIFQRNASYPALTPGLQRGRVTNSGFIQFDDHSTFTQAVFDAYGVYQSGAMVTNNAGVMRLSSLMGTASGGNRVNGLAAAFASSILNNGSTIYITGTNSVTEDLILHAADNNNNWVNTGDVAYFKTVNVKSANLRIGGLETGASTVQTVTFDGGITANSIVLTDSVKVVSLNGEYNVATPFVLAGGRTLTFNQNAWVNSASGTITIDGPETAGNTVLLDYRMSTHYHGSTGGVPAGQDDLTTALAKIINNGTMRLTGPDGGLVDVAVTMQGSGVLETGAVTTFNKQVSAANGRIHVTGSDVVFKDTVTTPRIDIDDGATFDKDLLNTDVNVAKGTVNFNGNYSGVFEVTGVSDSDTLVVNMAKGRNFTDTGGGVFSIGGVNKPKFTFNLDGGTAGFANRGGVVIAKNGTFSGNGNLSLAAAATLTVDGLMVSTGGTGLKIAADAVDFNSGSELRFGLGDKSDGNVFAVVTVTGDVNFNAGSRLGLTAEAIQYVNSIYGSGSSDPLAGELLLQVAGSGNSLNYMTSGWDADMGVVKFDTVDYYYTLNGDENKILFGGRDAILGTDDEKLVEYWKRNAGVDISGLITSQGASTLLATGDRIDPRSMNDHEASLLYLSGKYGYSDVLSGQELQGAFNYEMGQAYTKTVNVGLSNIRAVGREFKKWIPAYNNPTAEAGELGASYYDEEGYCDIGDDNIFFAGGFGNWEDLGTQADSAGGYQYSSGGVIAGVNRRFGQLTVGAAFAYNGGSYEDKLALANNSDIDNYTFLVDVGYRHESGIYGNLVGGYAYSDFDLSSRVARAVDVGGNHYQAAYGNETAAYHSNNWILDLDVGYEWKLTDCFTAIPSVGLSYVHAKSDTFTANWAGTVPGLGGNHGTRTTVTSVKNHSLQAPVELALAYDIFSGPESRFRFILNGGWAYEFNNEGADGILKWGDVVGTPTVLIRDREPGKHTWMLGAGLQYTSGRFDFSAKYDYFSRTRFDAHRLVGALGVKF